jgi:hypothetical protein
VIPDGPGKDLRGPGRPVAIAIASIRQDLTMESVNRSPVRKEMGHVADSHQRKARRFLEQAQNAPDPLTRERLVNMCELELVAAVSARHGVLESAIPPQNDRRRGRRRSSDV